MTQIQWFPGHMAKAIRLIEDTLQSVDFVIECRDARAPFTTRNPVLAKTLHHKKTLVVLTKKDLADLESTKMWERRLKEEGHEVLVVNVHQDPMKRLILEKTAIIMKEQHERNARRGIRSRASRALIVGVPNVGKSTIINTLASRRAARVENRPGVTQALKLVKVSNELEIIDTPGVLWPKFESQEMGMVCALIGSIKETGYPLDVVSDAGLKVLSKSHRDIILKTYELESFDDFFSQLAKRKGFLLHGGVEDIEQARKTFINDIQNGLFGGITWDR